MNNDKEIELYSRIDWMEEDLLNMIGEVGTLESEIEDYKKTIKNLIVQSELILKRNKSLEDALEDNRDIIKRINNVR